MGVSIVSQVACLQDPTSIVKDGAAVPAVAESIYFNTLFSRFRDVVVQASNNSDDSDTIAAISGCISGARVGSWNIPKAWRKNIELSDYLHDLANRLWLKSPSAPIFPKNMVNMAKEEIVEEFLDADGTEDIELDTTLDDPLDKDGYEVEF